MPKPSRAQILGMKPIPSYYADSDGKTHKAYIIRIEHVGISPIVRYADGGWNPLAAAFLTEPQAKAAWWENQHSDAHKRLVQQIEDLIAASKRKK